MLAYERHGSGEPLLLVHGIGHRRQAWYPVLDRLAEHFDVILVDLPGHGESRTRLDGSRPMQQALRLELEALLREVGVARPHVAGSSLGGLVALEMANHGLARTVTAISPAGFWHGPVEFGYIVGVFGSVITAASVSLPMVQPLTHTVAGRRIALSWLFAHPERVDPEIAEGDFRNLVRARRGILGTLRAEWTFTLREPCDVPITIAWAEKDRVLLPYQAERAREVLPDAVHLSLPDCGHVPMWDHPDLVAETIIAGARR